MGKEPVSGWPHHAKHGYRTGFWLATLCKAWLHIQFLAGDTHAKHGHRIGF